MVVEDFQEDAPRAIAPDDELVLSIDGFEGPLDLLLHLARDQKVDLTKISILALADQYLEFIQRARELRLEIAADYLVMAAWLAYLKSRMLLPKTETEEEPSGPEMAAALAYQLQRLEAMREVGARLMNRPRLNRDFFPRGEPEEAEVVSTTIIDVSLYDLLTAYADHRRRADRRTLEIGVEEDLVTVEMAVQRLRSLLGHSPDWRTLSAFLPEGLAAGLNIRSAIAATFAASLELAKAGELSLRQDQQFGPIYVRRHDRAE
jgi:segregation and condensation protein A